MEAIVDGAGAFPTEEVQLIVGGPLCPVSGLYKLGWKTAWSYGSKTKGVPGALGMTFICRLVVWTLFWIAYDCVLTVLPEQAAIT